MMRPSVFFGGSVALATLAVLVACIGSDPSATSGESDASIAEATTEDSAKETGSSDASVDAVDERTFCETLAPGTACEDFERGNPETHGWARDERTDGGIAIVLVSDGPAGASTLARTSLLAHDTSSGTASARFVQTVTTPGTTNAWLLDADVRLKPGAFGNIAIFSFGYDGLTLPASLSLADSDKAAVYVELADGGNASGPKFIMPRNKWVHLTMRIERIGSSTRIVAMLDGVQLSSVDNPRLPTAQHRIGFGLLTTATTGASTLEVDNFAFRVE